MKIRYECKNQSGLPQLEAIRLRNTGKALLALAATVAAASLLYAAGECTLTKQGPCGTGGSYTNSCGSGTNTFVYTISAGPDINICLGGYTNGYFDCKYDPVITNGCIQSYSYTACPDTPAGSGSVTNDSSPSHAIKPGCPKPTG
jgi:hypothetical protein